MKLLIIGGSGFVSGTLARLALAQGHEVWTITRGQRPQPDGVLPLIADRHDTKAFADTVLAAETRWDLVVDCIGFKAEDAVQDIEVFRECARHLVFISTDFVIDPQHRRFPQDENAVKYAATGYGHHKRLCELELMNGDTGAMTWTILRPCHIYGPGSLLGCLPTHSRDRELINRLRSGEKLKLVGGGHFLQQPIYAADLAALILSCADNEKSYRRIFMAAGPDIVESREYYRIIADLLNVELHTQEISVTEYLAANPDAAPFLCHRIYDLQALSTAHLATPITPLHEGLTQHVKSLQ